MAIRLLTSVLLKHILDHDIMLGSKEDEAFGNLSNKNGTPKDTKRSAIKKHEDLLDFDGPKLILGAKNWLTFYKLVGIVNFSSLPLWMSIMYKLLVIAISCTILYYRFALKILSLSIVKGSFRNPILLFITGLAFVTFMLQWLVNFRTNLFNLSPLYKILTTPKLCFIKEELLHQLGTDALKPRLVLHLLYALSSEMLVEKNLSEFIEHFSLFYFIVDVYVYMVLYYQVYGLIQMDLYIRLAFGHWLLALKSHMKQQFGTKPMSTSAGAQGQMNKLNTIDSSTRPFRTITFNEIQKNFNHMDDHLEVLRSIFSVSLVLISLASFLGTGSLCLLIYHLIVHESEYYHPNLVLIISVLSMLSLLSTYAGDRWVFYALASFVQSVEDEYFLQENNWPNTRQPDLSLPAQPEIETTKRESDESPPVKMKRMLLVRKKDVLFCREFLHQFENHLATPWSKLTFKSHLHMLRTFVTLVAAQIIFEHEH